MRPFIATLLLCASIVYLHADGAGSHGPLECGVISLRLVSICESEFADSGIEIVIGTKIATHHPRIACLGVCAGQDPSASPCIDRQQLRIVCFNQRTDLYIAQLTQIEVPSFWSGRPAEEQVRSRLHQPLALHHSLPMVRI